MKNLPAKNAVMQDDPLTRRIIACAIEVHKRLGPGLLERLYTEAMVIEMGLDGLKVEKNVRIPVEYRGRPIGEYIIDLLVEDMVILELKSVERHDPIFEAQILSYMKLTGKRVGLLINFNSKMVKDGIKRFVL
ncbi:MAG TPA: GxxExxY protein [Anaerolineales bacterium]|nr:GxxExxY protein [Anaerolineales bacterium]